MPTTSQQVVAQAQALIDSIRSEHRRPTPAEKNKLDDLTLDAEMKRFAEGLNSSPGAAGQGPGDALVRSDAFVRHFVDGEPLGEKWSLGAFEYMGAAGDPVLESTGTNADGIPPMWLPGLKTPSLAQEQPSLADMFSQEVASGPTIRYMKVTARNAPTSAVTVESQEKPGAEFTFDDATVTLQKLSVFLPISEEMLEDSPPVANYINQQLPLMVRQAEDKKLASEIYAAATGVGLSATIGGTDANGFDAIADAIKDVQINSQTDPDGLFIHPTDWWTLAVKKASTSGDYFSGGPYAAAARNPWGLNVVISMRAPAGFPLIGNFKMGATVYRSSRGFRLEMSNSHLGYFRENLVAIRAEVRTALAVFDPAAFSVANLAS